MDADRGQSKSAKVRFGLADLVGAISHPGADLEHTEQTNGRFPVFLI